MFGSVGLSHGGFNGVTGKETRKIRMKGVSIAGVATGKAAKFTHESE
jgi:hypothetical protein